MLKRGIKTGVVSYFLLKNVDDLKFSASEWKFYIASWTKSLRCQNAKAMRGNSVEKSHCERLFTPWLVVKLACQALHSVWSKLTDQTARLTEKRNAYPQASENVVQTLLLHICDAGEISSCSLTSSLRSWPPVVVIAFYSCSSCRLACWLSPPWIRTRGISPAPTTSVLINRTINMLAYFPRRCVTGR